MKRRSFEVFSGRLVALIVGPGRELNIPVLKRTYCRGQRSFIEQST